jgi:hypothetical protein
LLLGSSSQRSQASGVRTSSGTAISNGRMLADDGKLVTFRIKDYVSGKAATETITGEQFVRRFWGEGLLRSMPDWSQRRKPSSIMRSPAMAH